MLKKVLIANRGEIACRIARTAKRMGIATVAVYSDADARSLHVAACDEAVPIGPSPATESYLRIEKVIAAATATGADAIHPGYGFLSENADLPDACAKAGIRFVGPSGDAMRALGGKAAAKEIAIGAGVPVVPGYQGKKQDAKTLRAEAKRIGWPVMIKAVAGGGGRGMRLVEAGADFDGLLDSAKREAASAFGNDHVLIEKVVQRPRHIEVQVFGDSHGSVVHLFERDCSLQRRNQKVIEEAPAPGMSDGLRATICDAAVKLARSVGYEGAGTVEFLVEGGVLLVDAPWYFIEMNTRLQVEHPVTEAITGLDLVEWQFRVAAGEKLPLAQYEITMRGHAIELRLCAEDPARGFLPSIGRIEVFEDCSGSELRVETGVGAGSEISPFYDSMIAKLIAHGPTREAAIGLLRRRHLHIGGIKTNAAFLDRLLADPDVAAGRMDTGLIARKIDALTAFAIDPAAHADAVAILLERRARPAGRDAKTPDGPWDARDGFGLDPPRRQSVRLTFDGTPHDIDIAWSRSGGAIVAGGAATRKAVPIASASPDGRIFSLQDLVAVEIAVPRYDLAALDDAAGSGAVRAPINGRVAKIFVAAGDAIEKGTKVAVVEAMKMEHVLTAGVAGTVEQVAVTEGAQVMQGALIATIVE